MAQHICPKCKHRGGKVKDSRPQANGNINRRIECGYCGHRWSTIEIPMAEYNLYTDEISPDEKVAIFKFVNQIPTNLLSVEARKAVGILWRLTH